MADSIAVPPDQPNPLHGDGHPPPPPVLPTAKPPPSPIGSTSSPLGSLQQYHPAPRLRNFDNETSITGATVDDLAGDETRLPLEEEADWASPLGGLKTVLRDHAYSMLTWWFGYGLSLLVITTLFWLITGAKDASPGSASVGILFAGPPLGIFLDVRIIFSGSWTAIFGVALLLCEPALFSFFLFCHDARECLKYFGLTGALVFLKVLIYALVSALG